MADQLEPGDVRVTTRGEVAADAVDYARRKVAHAVARIDVPVLHADVELLQAADPARKRPAIIEAVLDVDGTSVRAQIAATTMHEAVDLLEDRLVRRLRRFQEVAHREGRERHRTGAAPEGGWRHGDLPTHRPEHFARPVDERELVRTKTFAAEPMTLDEAAFDLEMLGHDFYLFTEVQTGADAVLAHGAGDVLVLQLSPEVDADATTGCVVEVATGPSAPRLTQADAFERLEAAAEHHVFFVDDATGRGAVAYHRYDGHWGLITTA